MTKSAHSPLGNDIIRAIARLMHLHHQTSAHRLAERFGVTPKYIRSIYSNHGAHEQVALRQALQIYIAEPHATLSETMRKTELNPP